ncbi:MAG: hypothetical protein ACRENE_07510, partial [Polyangiaceae bacterium]
LPGVRIVVVGATLAAVVLVRVITVGLLAGATACNRPSATGSSTTSTSDAAAPATATATAPPSEDPHPPAPASLTPTAAPLPSVTVTNIGIHIGGGPNDGETKEPIAQSVARHFDELRACWGVADDPKRGGDFGVDLLIPAEGGRATVSNPRTAIHPGAFRDCVVKVFEQIDFAKPRGSRTMASYSLRFTP